MKKDLMTSRVPIGLRANGLTQALKTLRTIMMMPRIMILGYLLMTSLIRYNLNRKRVNKMKATKSQIIMNSMIKVRINNL
jgi:hypothetical protein